MKRVIQTFFFFSKRERIGVLCLLFAIITFLLAPRIYTFFKTETAADFTQFNKAINSLKNNPAFAENNKNTFNKKGSDSNFNTEQRVISLFNFNPNTISKDSLVLLGLSPKLANTINNYRNKGGKFFRVEDFKKMYGLSPKQYEQLLPYLDIPSKNRPKPVYAKNTIKEESIPINLSPFDPNTATENELQQLGFSKKVSSIFIKFRSKGGQFFKKEDVKKIYGVTEEKFQEIEPFINIPEKEVVDNSKPKTYANNDKPSTPPVNLKKTIKVDINKATATEWQDLYGIGPAYAKRIINFRNKLGGFFSIDQVAETYGIPDSTFQQIKPSLHLSPLARKISLNTCEAKDLSNHPYISYQLANTIIAYRKQHGPFQNVEDLKEIISLDEKTLSKVSPYLSIN